MISQQLIETLNSIEKSILKLLNMEELHDKNLSFSEKLKIYRAWNCSWNKPFSPFGRSQPFVLKQTFPVGVNVAKNSIKLGQIKHAALPAGATSRGKGAVESSFKYLPYLMVWEKHRDD